MRSTQPPNKTPIKYSELVWVNALYRKQIFGEYVLEWNIIEGL